MELVKLDIWFKVKNGYKKTTIEPEFNSDKRFFYSLRLKIDIELDKIKQHILSLFDNPENVNLIKPKHSDYEKQKIIDKLVEIKKDNLKAKQVVKGILSDEDFIICEHCRYKMYKIPVNVSYSKYGNSYIIHDSDGDVKYIYGCSNDSCVHCIEEDAYIQMMRLIELRDNLIKKGEMFVPNKFGFWGYIK